MSLMSSPDSGKRCLNSFEFKKVSRSIINLSVRVKGPYPTAAEVSFAPKNSPLRLNISFNATDPGFISL